MKTEQPSDAGAATGNPITLSVDAVIPVGGFEGSRLFRRGEPTPYRSIDEVPGPLKAFVAPAESPRDDPEEQNFANYSLGVAYYCDADGRRGRALRAQAAELARDASFQEQAEAIASAPPDEALASALAIVQEQHDIAGALQIKELEIRDRDADALVTAARGEGVGGAAEKPPAIYVKRGGAWMRAERARLRSAEPVFVKRPTGAWEAVGVVDATGALPPEEITT